MSTLIQPSFQKKRKFHPVVLTAGGGHLPPHPHYLEVIFFSKKSVCLSSSLSPLSPSLSIFSTGDKAKKKKMGLDTVLGYVKGVIMLGGLVWGAVLGSVVLVPLGFPLLFVNSPTARTYYHLWVDTVKEQWFGFTVFLLSTFGGVTFNLHGDVPRAGERILYLSNHRTRIDWMMLWGILVQCPGQPLRALRIILKKDLQHLPLFGWAMSTFRFIFLSRDWAKDQINLRGYCKYYKEHDGGGSFLIFPEGTDLSARNVVKAQDFAKANGHPTLDHVLYPKTAGTWFLLENLRKELDSVFTVTMTYTDFAVGERPNEMSILKGRMPKQVHVHFKRASIDDTPQTEAAFGKALREEFIAKNTVIEKFYKDGNKAAYPLAPTATRPTTRAACVIYWVLTMLILVWELTTWYVVVVSFLLYTSLYRPGLVVLLVCFGVAVIHRGDMDKVILSTVADDKKRD